VVIASITSCTNTSNPYVMIGAGLVARKARALGLTRKPWVKTSLAPGLAGGVALPRGGGAPGGPRRAGLQPRGLRLRDLHRQLGAARPGDLEAINDNDLVAVSVLSGNRNFEGRISPDVRANYLASPPLVVVYAIAGRHGRGRGERRDRADAGRARRLLKDVWPTQAEIAELVERTVTREAFQSKYADVFKGDDPLAGRVGVGRRDLRLAAHLDLHPEPALLPGHGPREGRDRATSRARASSRSWATW
jgi:aconitate hydratase